MAKDSAEKPLVETPMVPLVNGDSVPESQGPRFIVRNAGRYPGSYLLNGKSIDLEPGAFHIVPNKPSGATAHVAVQAF